MTDQTLYDLSCRAAGELLERLERGDLAGIEGRLGAVRHYLHLAAAAPGVRLRGDALYHREQWELLDAVVERLAASVAVLQHRICAEADGLQTSRDLLRHLVRNATPARKSPAAGCTSPAAPTA